MVERLSITCVLVDPQNVEGVGVEPYSYVKQSTWMDLLKLYGMLGGKSYLDQDGHALKSGLRINGSNEAPAT